MSATLTELKGQLGDVADRIKSLREKGDSLSESEMTELRDAVTKGKDLNVKIGQENDRLALLGDADDLVNGVRGPAPGFRVVGGGEDMTFEYDAEKGAVGKVLAGRDPLVGTRIGKEICTGDYYKSFGSFFRAKGDFDRMDRDSYKTLQVGVTEDGGALLPPQLILDVIRQEPGLLGVADKVRTVTTGSAAAQLIRLEDSGDDLQSSSYRLRWTAEGNNPSQQGTPQYKPFTIQVWEGEQEIPITRTMFEDMPNVVAELVAPLVAEACSVGMEDAIVNGTGINQPYGILTRVGDAFGPASYNVGNPADPVKLIKAYYDLAGQYAGGAEIAMKRATFGQLQSLTDAGNQTLFGLMSKFDGLATKAVEQFRGTPISFSDVLPGIGAANNIAIHADFRKLYVRVMRLGLSLRFRDIPGQQPAAVFRIRMGGDVALGRAGRVWVQS